MRSLRLETKKTQDWPATFVTSTASTGLDTRETLIGISVVTCGELLGLLYGTRVF